MANIVDLRKQRQEAETPPTGIGLVSHHSASPHHQQKPVQHEPPRQEPAPVQAESKKEEPTKDAIETREEESRIAPIVWYGPIANHNPDMKAIWIVIGSLVGIGVLFYFWQHNIFATILFVLLAVVLLLHVRKDLQIGEMEVNYLGVRVNEHLYRYRDIASFWIEYSPHEGIEELSIQLKKRYVPYIKVPLMDQNPVQIRTVMIDFVPEVHHPDNLADVLARRLGI